MVDRRPLGNILVATDFSAGAKRALERACRLPITPGCALTLLHVMPKVSLPFHERAERAVNSSLQAWAQEAQRSVAANVEVRVAIEAGQPFVQIGRRAEVERADLVVLGRHGRRAWPREALGSTADRLLRRGSTAVLVVVDAPLDGYHHPLVAVDEEGSAAAAIALMARIAPEVHGALAIHVLDIDQLVLLSQYELPVPELEKVWRSLADSTRRRIEAALDQIGDTDLDFDLRTVEGDPRRAILELAQAEQADLVAVGTHGRSGFRHLLLGSVAEAVIRGAQIDVLVVRAGPQR